MARLKNVEKVAQGLGREVGRFSDNSASWVHIEDKDWSICITFDGKGEKLSHIVVARKIYQVVEEKTIAKIIASNNPNQ